MRRDDYLEVQSPQNLYKNFIDEPGWTNDVLVHEKKNETEIFLPCYLRTKLKNIVSLDSSTGKGTINLVIILSVYYGSAEYTFNNFVDKIKEKIILRFKIDPAMRLTEGFSQFKDVEGNERSNYITVKNDKKQQLITYSIRRTLVVPLISHIFWSPFEFIKYVSTIAIESICVDDQSGKYKIYFNLMDINEEFDNYTVVSFTQQGALGEYDLARSLIEAEFTNKRFYSGDLQEQLKHSKNEISLKQIKNSQDEEKNLKSSNVKIESFQYGHSVYPVYRRPLVPFFNIFFPIMILGFINLAIFFQDNLISGKKIMNIAALLVSYIAFLPTIRKKIPPSKSLVISQILLFSMASLTILTLFHTIKVRDVMDYEFIWHKEMYYFWTMILTLIIIGVLCAISLVFLFVFHPKLNKDEERKERKFDRKDWLNKDCDKYFNKLREVGFDIKSISQYSRSNRNQNITKSQKQQPKKKKNWISNILNF